MKIRKMIVPLLLVVCLAAAVVIGLAPRVSAASMVSSDDMIDVLKTMEGFSAKPYWDYTQYTVGYGTKCPEDKRAYYTAYGITKEEAVALLKKELKETEGYVRSFAAEHGLELSQNQFDALVSFTYNLGPGWTSESDGYFNNAIRDQATGTEVVYAFCLNSKAGNSYVLMDRRICEADMYLNGKYQAYNSSSYVPPEFSKCILLDGNGGELRYSIYGYDVRDDAPVSVTFTKIPTGVDSEGDPFVYILEGWYTASGEKVETLDGSLENGQTLQAKWMTPDGVIESTQQSKPVEMNVTVTGIEVNIRSGPGTEYEKLGVAVRGDVLTITEVVDGGSYTWGKAAQGWVCLEYTDYESQNASPAPVFPRYGTVNTEGVNYRTGPGLSYAVAGQKHKGDYVTITEETTANSMVWGKMSDGYWISTQYVDYTTSPYGSVAELKLLRLPDKLKYNTMSEALRLEGSVLQITYEDGTLEAKSLTKAMISSYEKTGVGVATVTASYLGESVSFQVQVGNYKVQFLDWDGTVLSETRYSEGETVTEPAAPERPADETYTYTFEGWDKPVADCTEDAVYTAVYTEQYIEYTVEFRYADGTVISTATYHYGDDIVVPEAPRLPEGEDPEAGFRGWTPRVKACTGDAVYTAVFSSTVVIGDFDGDLELTDADAIYLLRYTLFAEQYPIFQSGDIDGDGVTTDADAVYLLRHTLFPEEYPLFLTGKQGMQVEFDTK